MKNTLHLIASWQPSSFSMHGRRRISAEFARRQPGMHNIKATNEREPKACVSNGLGMPYV